MVTCAAPHPQLLHCLPLLQVLLAAALQAAQHLN
jgi:hypothetical protein